MDLQQAPPPGRIPGPPPPSSPGFSPRQDRQGLIACARAHPLSARRAAELDPLGSPCPVGQRCQEKALVCFKASGTSRLRGWEEGRCWEVRLLEGSLLAVTGDTHVPRWGGNVCATGLTGIAHAWDTGQKQARPSASRAHPCLCVSSALRPHLLQNQTASRKANVRQRIIQWLLGGKIVNVLVPFSKPQPKKVTYKIPERKWRCGLWLRRSSCGRELWPSGHSEKEAARAGWGLTTRPRASYTSELWAGH